MLTFAPSHRLLACGTRAQAGSNLRGAPAGCPHAADVRCFGRWATGACRWGRYIASGVGRHRHICWRRVATASHVAWTCGWGAGMRDGAGGGGPWVCGRLRLQGRQHPHLAPHLSLVVGCLRACGQACNNRKSRAEQIRSDQMTQRDVCVVIHPHATFKVCTRRVVQCNHLTNHLPESRTLRAKH